MGGSQFILNISKHPDTYDRQCIFVEMPIALQLLIKFIYEREVT